MRYVVIGVTAIVIIAVMVLAIMFGAGYFGRVHDEATEAIGPEEWGEPTKWPPPAPTAEMFSGGYHIGTLRPGESARVNLVTSEVEKFFTEDGQ